MSTCAVRLCLGKTTNLLIVAIPPAALFIALEDKEVNACSLEIEREENLE